MLKKKIMGWAVDVKRRSRVYPVRIFKNHGSCSSSIIHDAYFKERGRYLSKYVKDRPKNTQEKQYTKIIKEKYSSWFIEDVLAGSIRAVKTNYKFVRKETGKGYIRQFLSVIKYSVFTPAMPETYYVFGMYYKSCYNKRLEFLHRYEMKNVIYKACQDSFSASSALVSMSNKKEFYCHASMHGLPIPDLYACVDSSNIEYLGEGFDKKDDLFIKPVSGKGGRGARRLEYIDSECAYKDSMSGNIVKASLLDEYLQGVVKKYKESILVQKKVVVCDDLKEICGKVAGTCRVMTIINEQMEPEVVAAVFRVPGDLNGVVDNFHAGGLAVPVDVDTGELGLLSYHGLDGKLQRYSKHPVTKLEVKGKILPSWPEVKELSSRAHKAFSPRVLVGWDVCITNDGPVIIEANAQPCTDFLQRAYGIPFGSQRLGKLIAFHLGNR